MQIDFQCSNIDLGQRQIMPESEHARVFSDELSLDFIDALEARVRLIQLARVALHITEVSVGERQ